MRRIAVAAALAAGAMLAVPGLALAATTIGVEDDFFSPARATATVGDSDFEWVWDLDASSGGVTEAPHDVVSRDALFGSELKSSGTYARRASAGTFPYLCTIHAGMTGKLRVKPTVREGDGRLAVRWATSGATTGDRYDVRYRKGSGRWRYLVEDTRRRRSALVVPDSARLAGYSFQARSQRGRGSRRQSSWSPTVAPGT